jgi:hypothetical protein
LAGTTGNNSGSRGGKVIILLGLFFGLGFMTGFFTGYGYERPRASEREGKSAIASAAAPETVGSADERETEYEEDEIPLDSELALEDQELGEDENGLFVSGTIHNRSRHSYDAVRVTFDLCDSSGKAYSGISDITHDRMAPGDSWGFTIYIPYSDMALFSSYRLQSIMGTSRGQ